LESRSHSLTEIDEAQVLIVNKERGPFNKIQDAINAVKSNNLATIKISPGLYVENLYIKYPNSFYLFLIPKQE